MRQFTEKDKMGLARALQTFTSYCNGQQVTVKTHLVQIDKALDEGITVDELLNKGNYERAAALSPGAGVEEYVSILAERRIAVIPLKDEQGWDEPVKIQELAAIFHDFYLEICAKGGTWSTLAAKLNLQRVIKSNTLQAIMSEALIEEVKQKTGQQENLTCFQYIQNLLDKQEDYAIDLSLSEQQESRKDMEADLEAQPLESDENEWQEEYEHQELETEGTMDQDDNTLYDEDYPIPEEEHMMHEAYIASINPNEFKRSHITDAIMNLTIEDIRLIAQTIEENVTLDELITKLTKGDVDRKSLSVEGRDIYQYINGNLYPHFLTCLNMQGLEISEATATKMDLLKENWDMRDIKTRKLQKLKELIYSTDLMDQDLLSVVDDLQQFYAGKHSL